jgi:hypothetical protein
MIIIIIIIITITNKITFKCLRLLILSAFKFAVVVNNVLTSYVLVESCCMYRLFKCLNGYQIQPAQETGSKIN